MKILLAYDVSLIKCANYFAHFICTLYHCGGVLYLVFTLSG